MCNSYSKNIVRQIIMLGTAFSANTLAKGFGPQSIGDMAAPRLDLHCAGPTARPCRVPRRVPRHGAVTFVSRRSPSCGPSLWPGSGPWPSSEVVGRFEELACKWRPDISSWQLVSDRADLTTQVHANVSHLFKPGGRPCMSIALRSIPGPWPPGRGAGRRRGGHLYWSSRRCSRT
jgi:hypothetical protein